MSRLLPNAFEQAELAIRTPTRPGGVGAKFAIDDPEKYFGWPTSTGDGRVAYKPYPWPIDPPKRACATTSTRLGVPTSACRTARRLRSKVAIAEQIADRGAREL